jgi:hypothetical protein
MAVMNRRVALLALVLASCASVLTRPPDAPQARADWSAVEAALGRSGTAQPGNVHKFGLSRRMASRASSVERLR